MSLLQFNLMCCSVDMTEILKGKISKICTREYICESGCPQYNRGKEQAICNWGKLHLEDSKNSIGTSKNL